MTRSGHKCLGKGWRLRPKRVPCAEVIEVFAADEDAAVLESEDNAAQKIEALAVALGAVVMNGDKNGIRLVA